VSTARFYTFTWEEEPDTIKFVYNCSSRTIVGKERTIQDTQACFPVPPEVGIHNTSHNTSHNNNSSNNSSNTTTTTVSFLEIDGNEQTPATPTTTVPTLPAMCTTGIEGKVDFQAQQPSKWCYDYSGKTTKATCQNGYVSQIGKTGAHWGKRRVSQCLFHEDDQTCAHGKWFDCEQLLNTDKEKRRASVTGIDTPVAIDDTLDDVVMRTRMNLFVGASTVSFSDTTDCQNTVTMKGVGFSASEKLFVFIGSAAPAVPYSIAYGINSTTPIVTYNDSRYPLPTTASFDDIAITGSLSSINRLEGTEPALQLTDCQVGAWRYVKYLYETCWWYSYLPVPTTL
jgi:hypothetical protein